jgi:hypothetical protein
MEMVGKKKVGIADRRPAIPANAVNVRFPPASLFRIVLFASLAVASAGWAIWRHYTVPPARMLVPKPAASEIEIEP